MAKDPAVLLYTANFLAECILMNYEQKGKFITLLCLQHQNGRLTEQDMLTICGKHDERIFSKFVQDENGMFFNPEVEKEIERRKNFIKRQQENGKKGGRPPKNETHGFDLGLPTENPRVSSGFDLGLPKRNPGKTEAKASVLSIKESNIDIKYLSFIEEYNRLCFKLPSVIKLTQKRKKAITDFLKQMTFEDFSKACVCANDTPFLTGKNERGWKAGFDFIIKPDNAARIIEGVYSNEAQKGGKSFLDLIKGGNR